MEEGLRDFGISAAQYAVMCTIELKPGSSNAELARLTFVTPQTMQGIIANLERDGLLRRKAARDHGRILRTELTARGKRLLKERTPWRKASRPHCSTKSAPTTRSSSVYC